LKPIELSDDRGTLKVEFHWFGKYDFTRKVSLEAPPIVPKGLDSGPGNARLWDCLTLEMIRSGDVLTFHTEDPNMYPLPSMDLLELQWAMQRVLALSGAAEARDEDIDPDWNMELDPCMVGQEVVVEEEEEEEEEEIPSLTLMTRRMKTMGRARPRRPTAI
jgi:hypothetical protein